MLNLLLDIRINEVQSLNINIFSTRRYEAVISNLDEVKPFAESLVDNKLRSLLHQLIAAAWALPCDHVFLAAIRWWIIFSGNLKRKVQMPMSQPLCSRGKTESKALNRTFIRFWTIFVFLWRLFMGREDKNKKRWGTKKEIRISHKSRKISPKGPESTTRYSYKWSTKFKHQHIQHKKIWSSYKQSRWGQTICWKPGW